MSFIKKGDGKWKTFQPGVASTSSECSLGHSFRFTSLQIANTRLSSKDLMHARASIAGSGPCSEVNTSSGSVPFARCVGTVLQMPRESLVAKAELHRGKDLIGGEIGEYLVTGRSKGKSGKRWHYVLVSSNGEVIRRRGNEVVAMIREAVASGDRLCLRSEWTEQTERK